MKSMQGLGTQLITRLHVGSVLITKGGTSYRVIESVVQVAHNGGVVSALVLEKAARGNSPKSPLMSLAILTKLMRGEAGTDRGRATR